MDFRICIRAKLSSWVFVFYMELGWCFVQYVNHIQIGRAVLLLCFDCGFGCAASFDCGFSFRFLFGFDFGFDFLSHYFIFGFDPELLEQANSTLDPPSSTPHPSKQNSKQRGHPSHFFFSSSSSSNSASAAQHSIYGIKNDSIGSRTSALQPTKRLRSIDSRM